jgi:3-hydroxyacyl-CoA dehydrogenase/enoyl-CoA hydratase/3-hydroxybutyryl-CoA epimerase
VTDEVSLELPMKIIRQSEAEMGSNYMRPCGYDTMKRMLDELGRGGRKTGGGFYDYPAGGQKRLWSGLSQHFPQQAEQPEVSDLQKRLLYVQALETARCLEEQVLLDPADGDLGSVLGWGFPSYTGGTLSLIDTVGAANFVAECDRLAQKHGNRFRPSDWLRKRAADGLSFHG